MSGRFREFWRGRTRPVGAENSRCHACHILRKRRRAAPATPPRGSSPAVSLDPAARSRAARWSLRRSRSRAGRASAPPGRGAPRRAAPARRFAGEKVPRKGRARGRRLGARDSRPRRRCSTGASPRAARTRRTRSRSRFSRGTASACSRCVASARRTPRRARTHEHPGAKSCQKKSSRGAHFCGTPKSRRISAELDAATSASLLLIGGDFFPPRPSSDILFLPFSACAPLSSTRPFADAFSPSPPTPPPPPLRTSLAARRSVPRGRGVRDPVDARRGARDGRRARLPPRRRRARRRHRRRRRWRAPPGAGGGGGGPFGRTVGRTFERPRNVGRPFGRLRRRGRDRGLGHGRDRGAGGAPAPPLARRARGAASRRRRRFVRRGNTNRRFVRRFRVLERRRHSRRRLARVGRGEE